MILIKYTNKVDFEYDIQGLLRSFFPGESTATNKEVEADLIIEAELYDYFDEKPMIIRLKGNTNNNSFVQLDGSFMAASVLKDEVRNNLSDDKIYEIVRKETKNRLKRVLYNLLKEYTARSLEWGTLSGIRPTKITSIYLEQGKTHDESVQQFIKEYYVSEKKANQCVSISENEAKILKNIDYRNGYSLYIGIPFCPSTCLYCSFTSYPILKYQDKIDAYLDAVCKELKYVAEANQDKKLETIYIGGGTPTTLEPKQLYRLLGIISELFDTDSLSEFTVEAGRPDSITDEKLKAIRNYNVSRISINPQTMKQLTLDIIGRHHTVDDFLQAYNMSRHHGFDNINMDFIVGLPNETQEDIQKNMEWVKKLKPDSLTIHSLAVKRAARLNMFKEDYKQYTIKNSDDVMKITREAADSLGLLPYYLYRQKNMAGNLENIGYAREGKAGIYNILIMEEKQSIIAVGAGSSTKMVDIDGRRITRIENVKDVDLYITNINEMIERKESFFNQRN